MTSVKKLGMWALAMLVAAGVFVPAATTHADSYYVTTESQRVIRESPVVIHEYTPPTVVREYSPPVEIHEYTTVPTVREQTIVTPMERENRLHAWWERHFRGDVD